MDTRKLDLIPKEEEEEEDEVEEGRRGVERSDGRFFSVFSAHLELGTSHLELGTIHPGDTCQGTSHLKLGTSHLEHAPIKNLARGDKPSARGHVPGDKPSGKVCAFTCFRVC